MRVFGVIFAFYVLAFAASCFAITQGDIDSSMREAGALPVGQRIAYWAEKFIGIPYDPDPDGEYVTKKAIVADERVDCMYLTFRAVELALSGSPPEALRVALNLRFITNGVLGQDGSVANYEDRFKYAEDMLFSGKWGRDVTASLGNTTSVQGSRGRQSVEVISKADIPGISERLESGDIIYFVKSPDKRMVGEIVGHIGIIKKGKGGVFLIHASGTKGKGGETKKVSFLDYVQSMKFVGVMVGRF